MSNVKTYRPAKAITVVTNMQRELALPNGEVFVKLLQLTGGFLTMTTDPSAREAFINNNRASFLPEQIEMFLATKNSPIIVVLDEIAGLMSAESQHAMMYHEEGHVVLGHLNRDYAPGVSPTIQLRVRDEMAADNHAAKEVGRKAMRRALIDCIIANHKFHMGRNNPVVATVTMLTFLRPSTLLRLAALSFGK